MNKEQLAFVVVVGLLALFFLMGGDGETTRGRRGSRGGGRGLPEVVQASAMEPIALMKPGDDTWSVTARNVFLAPRAVTPLPPLELAPPPFPRLPHPGLVTVPGVGGSALKGLRHDLSPDPKIELPEEGAKVTEETTQETTEPAEEGTETGDGGLGVLEGDLTLEQRITMKTAERLRREEAKKERQETQAKRRAILDTVFWPNGLADKGRIGVEKSDDDKYVIKREIDRLYADASLGDDRRRRALQEIRFVFWEDKGEGKEPVRSVLTGAQVSRIEFAETPLNAFKLRELELQSRPPDLQAHLDSVRPVFEADLYEESSKKLESMVKAGLVNEEVFAMLSDSHRYLFNYDKQLVMLQDALSRYPASIRLRGRLGQLYLRLKVPDLAEQEFKNALARDQSDALANLGLGQVLVQRGEGVAAVPYLSTAQTGIGLDKGQQLRARVLRGSAYLQAGDLESAEREFNSVLDRDPANPRGKMGAAVVELARGGLERAALHLSDGITAHSLHGGLRYMHGVCLLRLEKWSEARDELTLTLDLDPLLAAHVRTAMSYLMEKTGSDEAALSWIDQALVADPTSTEARLQRARVLLNLGDLDGAREEYQDVLESQPERVDVLVVLGDVAFGGGDVKAALRYYERAAGLDARFPYLQARMLVCHVRQNRLADAEKILGAFTTETNRDPFIQAVVAWYHYSKGNHRETSQRMQRLGEKSGIAADLREYAAETAKAVDANLSKVVWKDDFNRPTTDLLRGWGTDRGYGVNVVLSDKRVLFRGSQKKLSHKPTILHQRRNGREVDSFAIDLDMKPRTGVYAGVAIIAYARTRFSMDSLTWEGISSREGNRWPNAGIQVALSPDAELVYRVVTKFRMGEWTPIPDTDYKGGPVSLEVRIQDRRKERFEILVNNQSVVKDIHVPTLGTRGRGVELQIFSQAAIGQLVDFSADNVRIVTVQKR